MRLEEIGKSITIKDYFDDIMDKVLDIGDNRQLRDQYLLSMSKILDKQNKGELYYIFSDFLKCVNCCTGYYPRLFGDFGKPDVEYNNKVYFQRGLSNLKGYQMIPSVSSTINQFLKKHGCDCGCVHVNTQIDYDNLICHLEYFVNTESELRVYKTITNGVIVKKTIILTKNNEEK